MDSSGGEETDRVLTNSGKEREVEIKRINKKKNVACEGYYQKVNS